MAKYKKGNIPANPIKKGETRNPNGRPKHWITEIYAQIPDYSKTDILSTILKITALNQDQLTDVFVNQEATVLERTLAKAVLNGMVEGDIKTMFAIIERLHGKPTQEINIEQVIIQKQSIKLPNGDILYL